MPIDPEYCFFIGSYFPCSLPVTRIAARSSTRLTGRGSADYPYARLYPPVQDDRRLTMLPLIRRGELSL